MGQHGPIRDNDNPFLLTNRDNGKAKNGEVVGKKTKPTAEVENPFLLIKKKDGGTEDLPTGTETTPQSQSQSDSETGVTRFPDRSLFGEQPERQTIFGQSFLDRDISKTFHEDLDLSNPNLFRSKDKYSLRNLYTDPMQQRYDERIEQRRAAIKNNVQGLAEYGRTRIDAINKDIRKDQDEIDKIPDHLIGSGDLEIASKYIDQKEQLADNIAAAEIYKAEFKNSLAQQVAKKMVPAHVNSPSFTPRALGMDIIAVSDPEYYSKIKESLATSTLPGITNAGIERIGIDLAKDYLLNQPESPERDLKLKQIEEQEHDFDFRNIELTATRVREKLGAYFYGEGRSGFWGYSDARIKKAIADPASGLTDNEKRVALDYVLPIESKLVFSTDIPGSGLFRSGKDAIEHSVLNLQNTFDSFRGARGDAERAYDLLNDEAEGIRFRKPGESPTFKSELKQLEFKERKVGLSPEEKQRKSEIEKFVDVRNGWMKFVDGTGDLTGQVLEFALLTKGIGAVGRGLAALSESGGLITNGLTSGAFGTALANETTGLFLTGFLNSYDNYRSQALTFMPGKEKEANRRGYAIVMSAMEGLSERIFPDTKVLSAFLAKVQKPAAEIMEKFVNREITQELARAEFEKTLLGALKQYVKPFGSATLLESTEEAVVDIADGMSRAIFGGQRFDVAQTGKQAINTFLTTALHSGIVSGLAARGAVRQTKSDNAFIKSAIVNFAANPYSALKTVEDLRINGKITQQEANEKIQLIMSANSYLKQLPQQVPVTKEVKGKKITELKSLDYPQVASYLVHRLNEGILQKQIDNSTDETLISKLEEEKLRSQEIRKGIWEGTVGVTPDLQEVADEKKAQDLNIIDANTIPAEELLGTPFSNIQKQKDEKSITGQEGSSKEGSDKEDSKEVGGEKTAEQGVLTEKREGEATAPSLSMPEQVNKLLNEEIPKEIKYNNVTVTDVVTGKPLVGKFAPTKPLTARAATDAMKKRFETLNKLITCINS